MAKTQGAIRAGRAFVELFADDSPLRRGLKRAQQHLRAWGASLQAMGTRIAAVGAAITGPILAAARIFQQQGDTLGKMADRTGVAEEMLSALGFAAEQSGSNLNALGSALWRMRRRLARAAEGAGPAVEGLRRLGLSAETLAQLKPEDQLLAIADAVAGAADESLAAQGAFDILGDSAKGLFPLLRGGAQGIMQAVAQAHDLGLVMSKEDANNAEALGDAWNIVARVGRRMAEIIGAAVTPSLIKVAQRTTDVIVAVNKWIDQNRGLVVAVATAGAAITAAGLAIVGLGTAFQIAAFVVGGFSAALGAVGAAVAFIASPVGIVIAAITALSGAFVAFTEAGGQAVQWLVRQFLTLKQIAADTFGGIADALAAGDLKLAAEVALAGLKLAWLEATSDIRTTWSNFQDWLTEKMIDLRAGILATWADAMKFLTNAANLAVAGVKKAFNELEAARQTAIEVIGGVGARVLIAARTTAGSQERTDALAAQARNEAQALSEIEKARQKANQAAETELDEARRRADEKHAKRMQEISNAHADQIEHATEAAGTGADRIAAELREAHEAFAAAREAARQAREERGIEFEPLKNILNSLEQTTSLIRGTTQGARAEAALGAGRNPAERTANAVEKIEQHERELIAMARRQGHLVFG